MTSTGKSFGGLRDFQVVDDIILITSGELGFPEIDICSDDFYQHSPL
jgi:hypothetical protein